MENSLRSSEPRPKFSGACRPPLRSPTSIRIQVQATGGLEGGSSNNTEHLVGRAGHTVCLCSKKKKRTNFRASRGGPTNNTEHLVGCAGHTVGLRPKKKKRPNSRVSGGGLQWSSRVDQRPNKQPKPEAKVFCYCPDNTCCDEFIQCSGGSSCPAQQWVCRNFLDSTGEDFNALILNELWLCSSCVEEKCSSSKISNPYVPRVLERSSATARHPFTWLSGHWAC